VGQSENIFPQYMQPIKFRRTASSTRSKPEIGSTSNSIVLLDAARNGHFEVLKELLSNGADVNLAVEVSYFDFEICVRVVTCCFFIIRRME
jgi:hypothetical protein